MPNQTEVLSAKTAVGGKGPSDAMPMGKAAKKLFKAAKKYAVSDTEPGPNQNILAGQTDPNKSADGASPDDVDTDDGGTGPVAGDRKNKKKGTGDAVDWHSDKSDKADKFTVDRKEWKAMSEKADLVDAMSVRVQALEHERKIERLTARFEQFTSLPVDASEFAEKFATLEGHDPELGKYFEGLIKTMDTQVAQGALFSAFGSARTGAGSAESFGDLTDRILKDKFNSDATKYTDAMSEARKQRPDLFAAEYPAQAAANQRGQSGR